MTKSLFEDVFISNQYDADFSPSYLESVMNLKKGVITDEVMGNLLKSLSKYDPQKLHNLSLDDIGQELKTLGISDDDYDLLKLVVSCEGYDFSKTIQKLELKLQSAPKDDEKK